LVVEVDDDKEDDDADDDAGDGERASASAMSDCSST
jgi:hypothetical protein